jgi:hypothetical protein
LDGPCLFVKFRGLEVEFRPGNPSGDSLRIPPNSYIFSKNTKKERTPAALSSKLCCCRKHVFFIVVAD